jgi:hypothetical protein
MTNWRTRVKFRDLLEQFDTEAEDELEEVQRVLPLWIERLQSIPSLSHFVESLKKVTAPTTKVVGFYEFLSSPLGDDTSTDYSPSLRKKTEIFFNISPTSRDYGLASSAASLIYQR